MSSVVRGAGLVGLALVVVAACSEPVGKGGVAATTSTVAATADCARSSSIVECAPRGSMLDGLLPPRPIRATATPIRIGTINQDTGAAGAFPELTLADRAAVDFINNELDGVDGRPIQLLTCNTNFNPDLSQKCAQQMVADRVDAVVGGIDVWGTGIRTLANNGIPYIGGIPVSFDAARSPVSFQFSGGTWGAVLGMAQYATEQLRARRVAIIYADFGPIADSARIGQRALQKCGVKAAMVSVAAINADMVQALNTAAQSMPDAIVALTADSGCKPTMLTARQLGLKIPIMYTGACAAPKIISSVNGAAEGAVFNLEAELDAKNPDNVLYQAIARRYGAKYRYESQSAGTVSFRSMLNLYVAMRAIGAERVAPRSILAWFRAAKNQRSFFGHPYTCDGRQLEGYPAFCSPQQNLGVVRNGAIAPLTTWLDVGAFAR